MDGVKVKRIIVLIILGLSLGIAQYKAGFRVHPDYEIVNFRPSTFNVKVGGLDWLSDGRLVVADWGIHETQTNGGTLYVLSNVSTGDPNQVNVTKVAGLLNQPLGVTVVNNKIYVLEVDKIQVYTDQGTSGTFRNLPNETISGWEYSARWGEWAMGMVHKEGYLYFTLCVGFRTNPTPGRASVIRANIATKEVEVYASGARSTDGIGLGPNGDIFMAENNGFLIPTEHLSHVKQGHFYGYRPRAQDGATQPFIEFTFQKGPYQPPAVQMPHNWISNSPGNIEMFRNGIFKDQVLIPDIIADFVSRYFLEKIDGEYQGAVIPFSGGFETAPHRISFDPSGKNLIVGALGKCDLWCVNGREFGIQMLKYKNPVTPTFEILSVKSRESGMEIGFTQPVDPKTLASSDIFIEQVEYLLPENADSAPYGAPPFNQDTLPVSNMEWSSDYKHLFVELNGLIAPRTLWMDVGKNIQSELGDTLLHPKVYYTNTRLSTNKPFVDVEVSVLNRYKKGSLILSFFNHGNLYIKVPISGPVEVTLSNVKGEMVVQKLGYGFEPITFNQNDLRSGIYLIKAQSLGKNLIKRIVVP